jgi:hypothetical protein
VLKFEHGDSEKWRKSREISGQRPNFVSPDVDNVIVVVWQACCDGFAVV